MERRRTERRSRQPRRLTTTLLLQISLCSVALVFIVSVILLWANYQKTKTRLIEQVSHLAEQRVIRQSDFFQRIEANSAILGKEFLQRYQQLASQPQWVEYFDQWYDETEPGVFRSRQELYQGTIVEDRFFEYFSAFVGPREEPLTEELKSRIAIAQVVLNELAPAWQNEVANSHFSMPENVLMLYSAESAWGHLAHSDLVITDYEVVRSTMQETNPERKHNWTGLYYDLSAEYWTITHQRPVDFNGRHLLNASFDVALNTLLDDLVSADIEDARHMVLNQQGKLIAAQDVVGELLKSQGIIDVNTLDEPLYQQVFTFLEEQGASTSQTYRNALTDQVLIMHYVDGPGWWHVTLYPYQVIRTEAFKNTIGLIISTGLMLFLVLFIVYWFVNRRVSRPLTRLANIASMIDEDNYHKVLQSDSGAERFQGEVKLVLRSFRTMALRFINNQEELEERVRQRTRELARANEKLEHLAHLDGLTGLMNRRSFDRDLLEALSHVDEQPTILVLGDLDDFKLFNDNYGHEAGDRALHDISALLQKNCLGRVYRYGGEEIALLIPLTSVESAKDHIEKLRGEIETLDIQHTFRRHKTSDWLTISLGAALLQSDDTADKAIQRADRQLYRAKNLGGNQVCYEDTLMNSV